MLRHNLARIQGMVLDNPLEVLLGAAILSVVATVLGSQVRFQTSRRELAPPGDPVQARYDDLIREMGGSALLVAAVSAGPDVSGAELRAFTDDLADAFRSSPEAARVFHRVDTGWFLERGLYFAPPGEIRSAVEQVRGFEAVLHRLADSDGLAALDLALAGEMESRLAAAGGAPRAEAAPGARHLADLLRWQRLFLEDPEAVLRRIEGVDPLSLLAADPDQEASRYLSTRDGKTTFVLVTPANEDDSLPQLRSFVGGIRGIAARLTAERPAFRVALTGEPATTVEEMDTVRRDTWFTSLVAIAGVTLLTLLVFRWRTHSLLVLLALALGILWSLGAADLELGYLNLITSSFLSTLIGVGVAYGIHPVSEYELQGAHTADPKEAAREAYHRTGAAVTVAAGTTAAAFFTILLMRFRGFAELGLVAGVGVLLCLLAALLVLPALLVLHGRWRHGRDLRHRHDAVLDRIWLDRLAAHVCRRPLPVSLAAAALTAAAAWAAWGVGMDTNILDLLPRGAEAVRTQRLMVEESDLSPLSDIVAADDLEELARMRERAAREPTIARFESVLDLLPEDPAASRRAVEEASGLLGEIRLPAATRDMDRAGLSASLRRLEAALSEASEAAFAAGMGETAGAIEAGRSEAAACVSLVDDAPEARLAVWNQAQGRLLAWARQALETLRAASNRPPPSPENLPREVAGRYRTSKGRLLGYLHPAGDVFDADFLARYVEASRRVSPDAIGFPVVFHRMSRRITDGFHRAVAAGAVSVFLILLVDFRRLRDACLAMVPLVVGVVWMVGGMRLLGLHFNFANLVAVPLIIGVGIDNGVHVIHRVRIEGDRGMGVVLRHTGRAILIASLTTMIGFGSLALASHRGLASLGMVLLLGVGACLVTSTVVLPNLLVALRISRP